VQQKGVDSLIVHDLITLAHERAVATIYLLAGDEDLREGVAAAQRLGVQVILLGIPTKSPNQSLPLIREADEHVLLEPMILRQFSKRRVISPKRRHLPRTLRLRIQRRLPHESVRSSQLSG
jgi:uncharacterized LabA/DUF88 family protein